MNSSGVPAAREVCQQITNDNREGEVAKEIVSVSRLLICLVHKRPDGNLVTSSEGTAAGLSSPAAARAAAPHLSTALAGDNAPSHGIASPCLSSSSRGTHHPSACSGSAVFDMPARGHRPAQVIDAPQEWLLSLCVVLSELSRQKYSSEYNLTSEVNNTHVEALTEE